MNGRTKAAKELPKKRPEKRHIRNVDRGSYFRDIPFQEAWVLEFGEIVILIQSCHKYNDPTKTEHSTHCNLPAMSKLVTYSDILTHLW